jgi:hypothetical protein
MPNRILFSLGLLDEAVHPFHRMVAAVTFAGTLSLQAVLTTYFEPIKIIWYSFVLTFPLTTGLTIIFLILYNLKWKSFGLADLFIGVGFFALLFLALNGLYSLFGLEKVAKKYEDDERKDQLVQHYKDSIADPKKFQKLYILQERARDSVWKANHPYPTTGAAHGIDENLKKFADDAGKIDLSPPPRPWYIRILSYLAAPFAILWTEIKKFYITYGSTRFWSGVVLALCFSIYANLLKRRVTSKSSEPSSQ